MKHYKKIIQLIVTIFASFFIFFSFENHEVYASVDNTIGTNVNNINMGKDGSYGDISKAHEEKKKEDKGQDGKTDVEAGQWLQSHDKWVQFGTLMTWLGHQIGWGAIKGIYFISSYVEEAVTQIMSFVSGLFGGNLMNQIFGDSTNSFFNGATILAWTLLGVAITYWGLKYIWYGEKRLEIHSMLLNVVLVAIFLVASSTIISKTMDVGIGTYNAVKEETSGNLKDGFSLQIIKNNVVDLQKVLDTNNTKAVSNSNNEGYNNLTDSFIKTADMAEILEDPKGKSQIKDYLQYQISDVDDNGQISAKKIDNGWFSIFKSGYFRFGTRFFNIISELLIMAVALALYGYLILRNAIDLIFTKMIGGIAAAKDIERGEALRMVITDIGKSALGIACTGISLSVFIHLFNGINNQDWNPVAHTIALLACAVACLDGASVFDRYFGIDIGLRSGWQATVGAFAGAKTATSMAGSAVKTAGAVASGAVKGGTAIKNGVMEAVSSVGSTTDDKTDNTHSSNSDNVVNGLNTKDSQQDSIHDNDTQMNHDDNHSVDSKNESNQNNQQENDESNDSTPQVDADGVISTGTGQESDDDTLNATSEGDTVDETENVDDMDTVDADNQNLTSQEDDDMNSLDQTDLEENQMDENNTALDDEQLNQNVENDIDTQDNDVINGVNGTDTEAMEGQMQDIENGLSADEANDVDAGMFNRLEAEQMDMMNQNLNDDTNTTDDSFISHDGEETQLGTNTEHSNTQENSVTTSPTSSTDTTSAMASPTFNDGTSQSMYDNSTSMMNQLSQQSQNMSENHQHIGLGAMSNQSTSTFDPTRRVTTNTHIQMPNISGQEQPDIPSSTHESNGGGSESFDHTK